MSNTIGNFFFNIIGNYTDATSEWERFKRNTEMSGEQLRRRLGAAMTAVGTAVTGAMGVGIKSAIDFESAFAGVRKTVDGSPEELAKMREEILNLSTEIPVAATELAGIAEMAGQLGVSKDSIIDFSRTVADLGVATNLAGEEGATMLAQFANITRMDQSQFRNLANAVVALGNDGASTEKDIMAMSLRLASAGELAGLVEGDILGIASALSSVGIEAEAGGSAFSKVIIDMTASVEKGDEQLQRFADVAGMTADEFKQAFERDAGGALASFIQGLARIDREGGSVIQTLDAMGFQEVRMRNALMASTTAADMFTKSLQLGNSAMQETAAIDKEASERYKTTESQLIMLKNQFTELAIRIGDALLPALNGIVGTIKPIVAGLSDWAKAHPGLTKAIVALVAVLGGLMVVLGPLMLSFGAFAPIVAGLTGGLGVLAGAAGIGGVAAGLTGLLPILGVAAIAFVGLAAPIERVVRAHMDLAEAQERKRQSDAALDASIERLAAAYEKQGVFIERAKLAAMEHDEAIRYLNEARARAREADVAVELRQLLGMEATRQQIHRALLARTAFEVDGKRAAHIALSNMTDEQIKQASSLTDAERESLLTRVGLSKDASGEMVASERQLAAAQQAASQQRERARSQEADSAVSAFGQMSDAARDGLVAMNAQAEQARVTWRSLFIDLLQMSNSVFTRIWETGARVLNLIADIRRFFGGEGVPAAPVANLPAAAPVPAFAEGGRMPRHGLALVGERGPELALLPGGTQVRSNEDTRALLKDAVRQGIEEAARVRNATPNVEITINHPVITEFWDIKKISEELAREFSDAIRTRGAVASNVWGA